jgi:MoaA/NifB/PqqE/SkfB family radical SAM enzyme
MTSHYLHFLYHNLAARLWRQQSPLLCGFKITHRCNLRCRICPFWRQATPDIRFAQALSTMDELKQLGVKILIFEGGEPFIWQDGVLRLEDLVKEAKKRFLVTGITTNGTFPLKTSADTIWVSVDGTRQIHDAGRGESFCCLVKNIRASEHSRILANLCFSKLNASAAEEIVQSLAGLVKGITIQFYYPFPETEDLALSIEERRRVLESLISLKRQGLPLLDSFGALRAMREERWRCHSWLIASAEPDGSITQGCYLKKRAAIACERCGFTAHAEISRAYDWSPGAIGAGAKVFGFRWF